MNYGLVVISHVETDQGNHIVVMTFFPSHTACIKPRPYEKIVASFSYAFHTELNLAEAISEKGKRRLKIVMQRQYMEESERRALGSSYYSLLFGKSCGNDETQKGIADMLFHTMRELYYADPNTEDSWNTACLAAIGSIEKIINKQRNTNIT